MMMRKMKIAVSLLVGPTTRKRRSMKRSHRMQPKVPSKKLKVRCNHAKTRSLMKMLHTTTFFLIREDFRTER